MNQTFSFQRWTLLVAKHWAENRKRYLLSIIAFIGLLLLWFLFVAISDPSNPYAPGLQQVTYYFSLFIVGPFYASQYFRDLGSKAKATDYLLTPASVFEKFLCSCFYALLMFFLVFTAAFYLVDVIVVSLANVLHPSYIDASGSGLVKKAEVTNVLFITDGSSFNWSYYFILTFLAVQSAALLGSVYFAQYSYIKTAIVLSLLFILFYVIETWFVGRIMPPGHFSDGMSSYRVFAEDDKVKLVQLPEWIGKAVMFLVMYGFLPVFWATTYFRLKEKEV